MMVTNESDSKFEKPEDIIDEITKDLDKLHADIIDDAVK